MTPPTGTDRAPWEIEIRDGASPDPEPAPPRRRGPGWRLFALLVLGVACFAATVALLGWVLGGGDDAEEGAAPTTTSPITFAPRDDSPATAPPSSTTSTSTTTTSTSTTTTTTPTTTTAPSAGTGSVPALSRSSFGGGWVALLTSVPYSAGTARLEAAYAEVRGAAPGAVAARGEDWATLGDGFWVLVETGPFRSQAEARAWCAGLRGGRTDCAPRQLR